MAGVRAVVTDWRKALIYAHRWLGIVGCLLFLVWFASGVVMMYARMPNLTAEERLARMPALDLSGLRVSATLAAGAAGVRPDRVRVGMVGPRSVYRLETQSRWTTVFADTGQPLGELSTEGALAIARAHFPEYAATARHMERLLQPDQWTLDGGLPNFLPLHQVALGDAADTVVYVSERTGEPVMKTTARGRLWGYAGAVLHWTYFPILRQQRELWRYSIIYAALLGCVLSLSGLVIGVWRFSAAKRFRLKRVPSHSPYAGWLWWHHYAGLLFGLTTFTWALSGALSLTPWDWAPSTEPTGEQTRAMTGGPLDLSRLDPAHLQAAQQALASDFAPKELDVRQFRTRPFVAAYRPMDLATTLSVVNPDLTAIHAADRAQDQRMVWLDAPQDGVFTQFPRAELFEVFRDAMPGGMARDVVALNSYDAYYYDRRGAKPLPVYRARYLDPDETWLYVDPQHATIPLRHTRLSRLNRWAYNGFHSFDVPVLYFARPAWDILLITLSLGGLALSGTTLVPAWRRLRRHLARTTGC